VERTRLLVHVLDLAPELSNDEDADAVQNHATIEHEPRCTRRAAGKANRAVLALSKGDLVTEARARETAMEWESRPGGGGPGDRHIERHGRGASRSWQVSCCSS